MEKPTQLTSVKVQCDLFDEYKISCVRYKSSLNKLVNRAMDLYVSNEEFRKMINNHHNFNFEVEK